VEDLTTAINKFPHPLYFRLRGEALLNLGRTAEARQDFGRAGNESGSLGWYFSAEPDYRERPVPGEQ
jgi:predicted negative regulator of RcsB-dependent stress response